MTEDDSWQNLKKSIKPIKQKDRVKDSDRNKTVIFDIENSKDYSVNIDITIPHNQSNETPLNAENPANVSKATAKKLKSGKFPIEGRIDLHGMTQQEAFDTLVEFISKAYDQDKRCLLVITGKGKQGRGVLFEQAPKWLSGQYLRGKIVVFTYAQDKDGGKGALYVLLKNKKRPAEQTNEP